MNWRQLGHNSSHDEGEEKKKGRIIRRREETEYATLWISLNIGEEVVGVEQGCRALRRLKTRLKLHGLLIL